MLSEKLRQKSQFLQAGIGITELDRQEFCFMHRAETQIIMIGLSKGYPRFIDFDRLSSRIFNFKTELLEIIRGNITSYYREFTFSIHKELGKKASLPMVYMNRFEIFQVIDLINIFPIFFLHILFLLIYNYYYVIAGILWTKRVI